MALIKLGKMDRHSEVSTKDTVAKKDALNGRFCFLGVDFLKLVCYTGGSRKKEKTYN